jgi:hypothetical protein
MILEKVTERRIEGQEKHLLEVRGLSLLCARMRRQSWWGEWER